MQTDILPLAVAMMAGPQILSSIIFVTSKNPIKVSLAYIAAIALAASVGITIAYLLFKFLITGFTEDTSDTSALKPIQLILVGILLFLAIKSFIQREHIEQPKWLQKVISMTPRESFRLGFLLILLFPTDILIMLTTGANLVQNNQSVIAALPFVALTVLIAALPLLSYLLFRQKMASAMPRVRKWIDTHAWAINIGVYVLFIFLIL